MQPFRTMQQYRSACWPGVLAEMSADGQRITIKAPAPLRTLSNAVYGGGMGEADLFINWKVPLDYNNDNPMTDIERKLGQWGCGGIDRINVLMTAAKLTHASIAELEGDRLRLFCLTTAGTRNAARAGSDRKAYSAWRPGTINTYLLLDGQMTDSAMVNAIITAAEAKAAALQDIGLRDPDNGRIATGTTTDAIVLGVSNSRSFGAVHEYAGTATTVGLAIGRLVYETVYEAVTTQRDE